MCYHPENIKYTGYSRLQVIPLAFLAKVLGVKFKIEGMPFGSSKPSPAQLARIAAENK